MLTAFYYGRKMMRIPPNKEWVVQNKNWHPHGFMVNHKFHPIEVC